MCIHCRMLFNAHYFLNIKQKKKVIEYFLIFLKTAMLNIPATAYFFILCSSGKLYKTSTRFYHYQFLVRVFQFGESTEAFLQMFLKLHLLMKRKDSLFRSSPFKEANKAMKHAKFSIWKTGIS